MLCNIMVANCGSTLKINNDFYFIYMIFIFSFWIQNLRKLHFTNLANPKNPNLNLDCTDYFCEIRQLAIFPHIFEKFHQSKLHIPVLVVI